MNKIITIGREFGSGGREFGRRLSETLGVAYYDQEIISEIAKRTSLSEKYVQAVVEHRPSFSFPIHIGRSFYPSANPAFEQTMTVYQEQARIITEMAAKSDCVIVGRCADYILQEYRPFRIFVYADMASKIKRCREKGPEEEALSEKELRHQRDSACHCKTVLTLPGPPAKGTDENRRQRPLRYRLGAGPPGRKGKAVKGRGAIL
mgnify:CR=1 FL=1